MKSKELLSLFERGKRRFHIVGNETNGVLIGLDLEGRLFTIVGGQVANRVNPDAILKQTTRAEYLNPGGDGLWPAPEGTTLGYEYPTGDWRVPPGLTGARFSVVEQSENAATVQAEIDLINNAGLGVPTIFHRAVSVESVGGGVVVSVIESIEYIGDKEHSNDKLLLAPWTLCQFDCGEGCEVIFPAESANSMWDLYEPSDSQRCKTDDGLWSTKTNCSQRYQIALSPDVPWIEYHDPRVGLSVRRSAEPISPEQSYIDIVDAPPSQLPGDKGVSLSVYSDTDGFMEIEAAGGCPKIMTPGSIMKVHVKTLYKVL
jgi:hypothetical protein